MNIEATEAIDELYLSWLKETADFYKVDINEEIKQEIWSSWHEVQERKKLIKEWKNESA